ncbi:Endoribonuclease YbeY, partial [Lamellibrachia satsuma]
EQIAGEIPQPQHPDEYNLGDIFLLPSYIAARCEEENHELHDMMTILLTHGLCHLLGYDHGTEEQWKQMFHQELHVLDEYSKLTGVKLRPITTVGH